MTKILFKKYITNNIWSVVDVSGRQYFVGEYADCEKYIASHYLFSK